MNDIETARQIETRRVYRDWEARFWRAHTTLAQIATEDFPDDEDDDAVVTRYHVDAMRDLALGVGALVAGRD